MTRADWLRLVLLSLLWGGSFFFVEIALTALDTLNASGKTIGVISHVDALKERIPAQIRVDKGGGIGHSRLSIGG